MPIGEICSRQVVFTHRTSTIKEAALLMRQYHVGDLVVAEENGKRRPVGIITDRDIVISVIAQGLDPNVLLVEDVMRQEIVTAPESQGVYETVQQMRAKGVRRLPILGAEGELVGIVAVDDLVQLLAEEMGELGKLISREQVIEVKTRR